jgi:hypothetical protein
MCFTLALSAVFRLSDRDPTTARMRRLHRFSASHLRYHTGFIVRRTHAALRHRRAARGVDGASGRGGAGVAVRRSCPVHWFAVGLAGKLTSQPGPVLSSGDIGSSSLAIQWE